MQREKFKKLFSRPMFWFKIVFLIFIILTIVFNGTSWIIAFIFFIIIVIDTIILLRRNEKRERIKYNNGLLEDR